MNRIKDKARVLVVGPLPPPVGGVETFTAALLESNALEMFAREHCDLSKKRAKYMQGKFDLGNFFWALIHFSRMFACLIKFRPNIVYMPLTASWSGFLRDGVLAVMAKLSGARVVGHVHGGWFDRILALKGWRSIIVRAVLSRFDVLLMLGSMWRDLVASYGYSGDIRIVPPMYRNSIRDVAASFVRKYSENELAGLFVGHVGPGKGVVDLMHAVSVLRARGVDIRITIVGPAQFEGDWEKVCEVRTRLGLDQYIEMTGPLEGEALYGQFRAASYFLLPSHFEGLPIVLFEAGLFGLPVITTPVGAIRDLVAHDKNGLLVSQGNVDAIADAIERFHQDSTLRERLGRQLRKDVERYDPKLVCGMIAAVISEVLNRHHV